jgi:hypothetical protein
MRNRLVFLLILIASSASAEERCLSTETPRQCMKRLITTRAYVTAQAALAGANTGPGIVSSPIRSAVKDFLSAGSAQIDGSSVKDSGQALTIDYNLPGSILGGRHQVNLEVTLPDPQMSTAVAAEAGSTPPEALTRGDDVLASLSFNPVTRSLGRSLAPHRALFDSMLLTLVGNATPGTTSIPAASFDTPFAQLVPDAAARMTAIAEFETTMIAAIPPVADVVTQDLTRLANNQPQLFVSVLSHYRKPKVGQRESGYRLTWEIGTDNINSFRRGAGRDCEAQGTCLAAFNDYTSRTAAAHNTSRLSLSIEFHRIEPNNPALTAPPVIQLGSHKLTYSAIYGHEFISLVTGKPARIDLALNYDGKNTTHTQSITGSSLPHASVFLNVPPSQLLPPPITRYSAAATVTQPLFGGVSIPISVVWAEHTDWLPGTQLPPVNDSPQLPSLPGNGHTAPFSMTSRTVTFEVGLQFKIPSPRPSSRPTPQSCCCK